MKKIFNYLLICATVLILGSTNVCASEYWEDYFKNRSLERSWGIASWENQDVMYHIYDEDSGGMGSAPGPEFEPYYYNEGLLFTGVINLNANSASTDLVNVVIKDYDFSKEREHYEDYKEWYANLSEEAYNREFNERNDLYDLEYKLSVYNNYNPNSQKTLEEYISENGYVYYEANDNYSYDGYYKFSSKRTWWEDSGYATEPTTWWEAYELASEPQNGKDVIFYAKDLGVSSVTLSADGKSNITISTKVSTRAFGCYGYMCNFDTSKSKNKAQGLIDILNDLDKYSAVLPSKDDKNEENQEYGYNFSYYIDDKEDLSGVVNALKGKDITISFYKRNDEILSTYKLNGLDVKNEVAEGFTYDHKISMETSINKDKIYNLADIKDALYIDFTYHGSLPANYTLKINIKDQVTDLFYEQLEEKYCGKYNKDWDWNSDEAKAYDKCMYEKWLDIDKEVEEKVDEYFKNQTLTLLYYNPDTDKMEVTKEGLKADENGIIEIEFDHFSTYVLVGSADYKILASPRNNNAQTSNMNVALYGGIALVSLIGIACLVRNRKEQ